MKAVQFERFGNPTEVVSVVEKAMPEPGPGQVRIRLTHRAINPSDLMTLQGLYGRLPRLPATPGMEGMGVIDALGEGVAGFTVGQRVVPMGVAGAWAEYGLCKAALCIPVPEGLSDQSAAQFVGNPVTAWVMLTEELGLEAGDWLLQTAAGSTLGRIVLQLAQLQGYKTVNFVRRPEQVQELLDLGADAVFCTADAPEKIMAQVKEVTGSQGVKGAIEAVGGETGTLAHACLRPGGTMIVYGLLSLQPSSLNWGEMLFKGTTVRGFWLTYWFSSTPQEHVAETLTRLMGLMLQGDLTPPVEAEYDLDEIVAAVTHAERPGRRGKVLLVG